MKIVRVKGTPHGWLTVGWWGFSKPHNKGELIIEVSDLESKRFFWAVVGHELIEAAWCKVFGITTEVCDAFDLWAEQEYAACRLPKDFEAGFHKNCPYRGGHVLGFIWEWVWIHATLGDFDEYDRACNEAMGLLV